MPRLVCYAAPSDQPGRFDEEPTMPEHPYDPRPKERGHGVDPHHHDTSSPSSVMSNATAGPKSDENCEPGRFDEEPCMPEAPYEPIYEGPKNTGDIVTDAEKAST
eukprot:jgi/Chrzof1/8619/Cz03g17180.t1